MTSTSSIINKYPGTMVAKWDHLAPSPCIVTVSTHNFCHLVPSPLTILPTDTCKFRPLPLLSHPLLSHSLTHLHVSPSPLTISPLAISLTHTCKFHPLPLPSHHLLSHSHTCMFRPLPLQSNPSLSHPLALCGLLISLPNSILCYIL